MSTEFESLEFYMGSSTFKNNQILLISHIFVVTTKLFQGEKSTFLRTLTHYALQKREIKIVQINQQLKPMKTTLITYITCSWTRSLSY